MKKAIALILTLAMSLSRRWKRHPSRLQYPRSVRRYQHIWYGLLRLSFRGGCG